MCLLWFLCPLIPRGITFLPPSPPPHLLLHFCGSSFLPLAHPKCTCFCSSLPFLLITSAALVTSAHGSQILLPASVKDPMRAPWHSPSIHPAFCRDFQVWFQPIHQTQHVSAEPSVFLLTPAPASCLTLSTAKCHPVLKIKIIDLSCFYFLFQKSNWQLQNLPTVSFPNLFAPSVVWILTYTLAPFIGSFLFHSFITCCQIHLFIAQLGSYILLIF